jgi:2-oxoglutarate ferredoxin oxidoreductase subunit alpha
MGEVPLVIVDVQRMGPATGGATTAAQGDLQFIRWCTSGGYPIVVLCPATVADCYTLAMRAFDLAERFRCPVFLLTDKEVASTMDTVDVSEFSPVPVRERSVAEAECFFHPCDYPDPDQNVPMSPYGGPHLLRFTTSTHDERGYLTKAPAKVEKLNRHLTDKLLQHQDEIDLVRTDSQEGAQVLLISYGITARAVQEAVREARAAGERVSSLTLLSLWPVPEQAILHAAAGKSRVVVAELNDGQLRREVERLICTPTDPGRQATRPGEVVGVHRIDGELITPQQILIQGGLH